MLGVSYFATDQYAETARTFAPLGDAGMKDSETGYAWTASLVHTGDLKAARQVLTAFASEPRTDETLLLVGQLWTEIGDYARAIATIERALRSDADVPKTHFYEGLAYIRWEHWSEAAKEFETELSLNPGDPGAIHHLGFVYLEQSKVSEAAVLFSQVIEMHADYANAQYELGKILLDRGQLGDAVAHLELAAKLWPQTDYVHYQLQAGYRKQGRTTDADRELEIYKKLESQISPAHRGCSESCTLGKEPIRLITQRRPFSSLYFIMFSVSAMHLAIAQMGSGHFAPTPPPPGAKATKCSGRPVPQLEDITAAAGITFKHTSDPSKRYIVESMSGGVILIDYDRDGWPDIYFTNAPGVEMAIKGERSAGALYHNNHNGTFTDVTAKSGLNSSCFAMGGAVGDYNNDGWPDLYLTCLGGNILYRNNGNGTFTDVTAKAGVADGRWSTGAAFGDYDGDGFADLMVANYVDFHLDDLPRFGSASFCKYKGIDVQCGPRGLRGAGDSLFHNNGDGTFTEVSKAAGVSDPEGYYGLTVAWVDFNNTGRPDIYVANDSTPKYLYKNLGNGKFDEIGLQSGTAVSADGSEQASMGLGFGDYNHTGRPSIFVTNFADENVLLYRNDGNWDFNEDSYASGVALPSLPLVKWGTAFVDLDNDGWLDLILVGGHVYPQVDSLPSGLGYRQSKLVALNQKNGTFCDASDQAGDPLLEPRVSRGLAVGDLFNDGNMDVVIEDLDGSPMLLRNHGIAGRHWVSFELDGTKSNRLALNARITVVASGMTQTDEIRSGGSYLSQNDLRLHFGLGAATKIDKVQIHWPSGLTDELTNLAADRDYNVLEGKGIVDAAKARPVPVKHR